MSAEAFCCRRNLKKEEDSLASSRSILNDNKKLLLAFGVLAFGFCLQAIQ